jgi:prepilin-type N-terminal cleavage/methylation domain-containing protein
MPDLTIAILKCVNAVPDKLAKQQSTKPFKQGGFNLVEVAIALVILALALGGLISAFAPRLALRGFTTTQAQLVEVNEAVLAFAATNRRLPCPATLTSGGLESFCTLPTGACAVAVPPNAPAAVISSRGRCSAAANTGFLPAATLGLTNQATNGTVVDAWAGALQYVVPVIANTTRNATPTAFATPVCGPAAATCFPYTQADGIRNAHFNPTIASTSDLFVCASATGITAAGCGGVAANQRANPAFVIFSLGQIRPGRGTDETANTNADRVFVSHERTEGTVPGANGEFDDLVVWTSMDQLRARMQGSGVVP